MSRRMAFLFILLGKFSVYFEAIYFHIPRVLESCFPIKAPCQNGQYTKNNECCQILLDKNEILSKIKNINYHSTLNEHVHQPRNINIDNFLLSDHVLYSNYIF